MTIKLSKIEKSKIAVIQLRRAIQLYNAGDFISSLTLAGAANEIFAQFAMHRQGYNTLDGDKTFWDSYAQMSGKNKPSKDKIRKVNNRIKNALKHHDKFEDEIIKADFEFEAQSHIDYAIRNYWIAFDNPINDRIVNKYVSIEWM